MKTKVALIYDFDKTLCSKDMQEYSFIPNLNMKEEEFWHKVTEFADKEKMDKILAYMYIMIKETKKLNKNITKDYLKSLGKDIELFNGVNTWFDNINKYAEKLNIEIEHYIVSSGIKEIIEGTTISKYFKEIYACQFLYEQNIATWPKLSVNYTAKTQFISRINKGVLDIADDVTLNKMMSEEERRIPSRNIIYFGDGLTDIPSMRMTRSCGGYAIAVYQNNDKKKVFELIKENRIDFYAKANYTKNSSLDKIVKTILHDISIKSKLNYLHKKQIKDANLNKIASQ